MKQELENKDWQNPLTAYMQGISHGANQEALHTLEKEQSIIRTDIAELKKETKAEFSTVKANIQELREDISEVKLEMANLRTELKEEIAKVKDNLQGWLITILVAVIGATVAIWLK